MSKCQAAFLFIIELCCQPSIPAVLPAPLRPPPTDRRWAIARSSCNPSSIHPPGFPRVYWLPNLAMLLTCLERGELWCDYETIAQLCIYPSLRGHSFSLSCPLRSRCGQIESACRKLAQVARGNQVTQTFSPKWSFPQEGGRNRYSTLNWFCCCSNVSDLRRLKTNMVCRLKSCRPDAAIFRLLVGIWRSWRIASSSQAGAATMVFVRCLSLFIFSLIVCLCNILSIGKDGQETSWSPQRSTWPARRRDPLLASLEPHTDRQLAAKEDDSIEKLIPSDFGQVVKQWIGGAAPSRKYSNIEKV